eukprot:SAG11_NODE_32467_length_283_cov_0.847826_1_plen_23_part_10
MNMVSKKGIQGALKINRYLFVQR